MKPTVINLEWKDRRRPTWPRPFNSATLCLVARLATRYPAEIHIERGARRIWTLTPSERHTLVTYGERFPLAREIVAEIGGGT